MFRFLMTGATMVVLLWPNTPIAQMTHDHSDKESCKETTLSCATKVTAVFSSDESLWLAWMAAGHVTVANSHDFGRSFTSKTVLNTEPLQLDWGPDARPKIMVDKRGGVVVAFAVFKDKAFNGQVLYTRSDDGGVNFAPLRAITANPESQRFETLALDADGAVFAAWLDKRNREQARARNEKYAGAALAFAWSNDYGTSFGEASIAKDNTCECCRLGVAFAGSGRPVVVFRNIFEGSVRDHAVMTFIDPATPGPIHRVSEDDWKTEACPHHGPSLAIGADGTYHVTWFTSGRARRGLFYARSTDGGQSFSPPMPIGAAGRTSSHPYVLSALGAVWLAWKEFDGERSAINIMVSRDDGRTWSVPKVVAQTTRASDHPLLVSNNRRVFLSWLTEADGYRLLPVEDSK